MTTGKKRGTAALLVTAVLFVLTACSMGPAAAGASGQSAAPFSAAAPPSGQLLGPEGAGGEENAGGELVVYFSVTGNTRAVAETLADMRGAQLWEIVPEAPYTAEDIDYGSDGCRANAEQNDDAARPAIAGGVEALDGYDVIYVGFPIWWGNMPRILYTFFDACDLSGKTIAPFCTSGGSGISAAVEDIARLEPDATVTEGLRAGLGQAEESLVQWLNDIGL